MTHEMNHRVLPRMASTMTTEKITVSTHTIPAPMLVSVFTAPEHRRGG